MCIVVLAGCSSTSRNYDGPVRPASEVARLYPYHETSWLAGQWLYVMHAVPADPTSQEGSGADPTSVRSDANSTGDRLLRNARTARSVDVLPGVYRLWYWAGMGGVREVVDRYVDAGLEAGKSYRLVSDWTDSSRYTVRLASWNTGEPEPPRPERP